MCGIGFILYENICKAEICKEIVFDDEIESLLKRRGPDSAGFQLVTCGNYCLKFYASVLHLRGSKLIEQPAQDKNNNLLLWNGEVFDGLDFLKDDKSDTEFLLESLSTLDDDKAILDIFQNIHGPWAFIYWQQSKSCLWFGRDVFGRRSLLWNSDISEDIRFAVTSTASVQNSESHWEDVPANGIYCLNIKNIKQDGVYTIKRFPWKHSPSGNINPSQDSCIMSKWRILNSSITLKPPIYVPLNKSLPSEEFENSLLPNAINSLLNSEIEGDNSHLSLNTLNSLSAGEKTLQLIKEFTEILGKAVEVRVKNHPLLCKNCLRSQNDTSSVANLSKSLECKHASVAILFSGGLDSVVLAALADRYIPENIPIDLLNVSFERIKKVNQTKSERKRTTKENKSEENTSIWLTPDRITGKQSTIELQKLSPNRTWNFVEINVTRQELQEMRTDHICHIIYPCKTVLDDSIGCACWFAARGNGLLTSSSGIPVNYKSSARVILLGMGADELLGGYSRHRIKFNKDRWKGLLEELTLEIDRLPTRNLGRDDRIISDHGCEARFPFLDEKVVNFLNNLPVWLKVNLNYSRGIGEKLLLRLVAENLNLKEAAVLPKRAIQFGSRIAHSEEQKEKGSDLCSRLNSAI